MDSVTKEQRSKIMARVRARGNRSTEVALAAAFRKNGISGWRRHALIHGKPDFIFQKLKLAIFVDGCFWHGCKNCYRAPNSNIRYWQSKIERNRKRDRIVNRVLAENGWTVLRVRECQLKAMSKTVKRISAAMQKCRNRNV